MSDYYEKYLALTPDQKHRLYMIENDNSFDSPEEIACPYCNTPQHSIEGPDVGYEQDEETEITCDYIDCGKTFTAITNVSYSWATSVPDEEALAILEAELEESA